MELFAKIFVIGSVFALAACESTVGMTRDELAEASAVDRGQVNEDGEAIICRTEYSTGSRVRSVRTCATMAEWRVIRDEASRVLREENDNLPDRPESSFPGGR